MSKKYINQIVCGNCLDVMSKLPDNSIDACVTDPPYGLSKEADMMDVLRCWLDGKEYTHSGKGFMDKEWDSFVPGPKYWSELYRVLKPGSHALVFCGTRTYHLIVVALSLAGFEIRDQLQWIMGQGFPKSLNIGKAVDKALGAKRKKVKKDNPPAYQRSIGNRRPWMDDPNHMVDSDDPVSEEAKKWDGWGTGLKPAFEPICLVRKPISEKNVAENILRWGVGGLNIDATRIGYDNHDRLFKGGSYVGNRKGGQGKSMFGTGDKNVDYGDGSLPKGRYPSNVMLTHHPECKLKGVKKIKGHKGYPKGPGGLYSKEYQQKSNIARDWNNFSTKKDNEPKGGHADKDGYETVEVWDCHPDCPVHILDSQSGHLKSGDNVIRRKTNSFLEHGGMGKPGDPQVAYGDSGGASRFFYCAKASQSERKMGCGENPHPTVKPIKLCEYLVQLITPEGGIVIDPFVGSGSVPIAAQICDKNFIGIDFSDEYCDLARKRLSVAEEPDELDEVHIIHGGGEKTLFDLIDEVSDADD